MRLFPETIPTETKGSKCWSMWKKELNAKGEMGKVPYQIAGGRAESDNPDTWCTFDAALMAFQDIGGFDGICWMMPVEPSDIVFIDIDDCIKDGKIEPWAQKIVDDFNSYTEKSQSENGLHILINGKKPIKRCRKHDSPFEIYDHLRPAYLTGDVIDAHTTIECRQEPLDRLFEAIFAEEMRQAREPQRKATPGSSSLSDEALILKATLAKNGSDFNALWAGSTIGYGGDESAADMALVNMLAFWTGGDALQMDRLFRQSKLMRPKWDEKRGAETYGQRTIRTAIAGAREFYKPGADHPKELWETTPEEQEALLNAVMEGMKQGMSQEEFDKFKMPEGPKFSFNLPADHFLSRFAAYGAAISDAYAVYWFMAGLFMLGTTANKKIKFVTMMDTFYPNIWIYILGDSSLARKTTAVKKANAMLNAVLGAKFANACVPNTFSPEAFIEHMSSYQHASWVRDEAAGVLSIMQKDYMRGFKDDLMQLFDCSPITRMLRTKKNGEPSRFNVDDPYMNVFFASTGAALGYNLDLIDKETGFLVRFMFAYPQDEKEGEYKPLDKGAAVHSEFEDICISQLSTINAQMEAIPSCIDMTHSPDARLYYNTWQETREKEYARLKDGYSSQIFSRLNPAVLKMAMLFEMGSMDFDPTRPIREEYFKEACRLVDSYFMPTTRNVYDLIGTANKDNQIEKVILYLSRHGGSATRKEIMRDVKIKSKDMTDYLSSMDECGLTETRKVWNPETKRNTSYVCLVNHKVVQVGKVIEVDRVGKVEDQNIGGTVKEENTVPTLDTFSTTPTSPTFHEPGVECKDVGEKEAAPSPAPKEDPDRAKFKAKVQRWSRNTCRLCGQHFEDPLTIGYHGGGYICERCRQSRLRPMHKVNCD